MNLKDCKRGWFIGDFEPSFYRTDKFEVGVRHDKKGMKEDRHYHKHVTEYIAHIGGRYLVDGIEYGDGSLMTIKPYQSADYECLEDGYVLVIKEPSIPWDKFQGDVLNIVVLMAGKSTRFWSSLKPLVDINGKTMIERVIENIRPKRVHRFIFVCLKRYQRQLSFLSKHGKIIWLDKVTEGPACSALAAKELINNGDPLLISDSDQLIHMDFEDFYKLKEDARVMVTHSNNPAFSYVKVKDGRIIQAVEKEVISDISPCGKHLFKKGRYFVQAAESMIKKNKRAKNGEFYMTPIYNEMLDKNVGIYWAKDWWDLGTPENLQRYLDRKK